MPQSIPMIVAHRGLHTHHPENSLSAFVAAANAGLAWVECDVWPSADNVPVMIHDPMLERTTAGIGEVRNHTFSQLQQLGLSSLGQVIEALNALTAPGLAVEIKPRMNRPFVQSVLKALAGYDGTCLVQSFHDDNIVRTWSHDDQMHTAMLVDNATDLKNAIERGWPFINAHHSLVDEALVTRLHSVGRRIGAWTVNDADDIRNLVRLRIDMLTTDEPVMATQIATET